MAVREISIVQALNEALREEMRRDPTVFLMGEDVASPLGDKQHGSSGVSTGLIDEFGPKRVRNTPISESAIIGAALGAALVGCRPVAELMFIDLIGVSMDQIMNQVAKVRYMFGGQSKAPLVIRTPGGAGVGLAGHHSASLEAMLVHIPGLVVVQPSTPYDAKGLLKAAIRDDNPVIFLEQKFLYAFRGLVPDADYELPLSKCDIKRPGKDVTVVASGLLVWYAMLAAKMLEPEGIDVEVVDVRTISPLDEETIGRSARKTGRVVVAAEACRSYGPTGEWMAVVTEQAFDYLQAPVVRVTGRNTPIPFADSIEKGVWPDADDVVAAIRKVMA